MLKDEVTPEIWEEHAKKRRLQDYGGSYKYIPGAAALLSRPWTKETDRCVEMLAKQEIEH